MRLTTNKPVPSNMRLPGSGTGTSCVVFTDVYAKVPRSLREQYEDLIRREGTGHEADPDAAFPL